MYQTRKIKVGNLMKYNGKKVIISEEMYNDNELYKYEKGCWGCLSDYQLHPLFKHINLSEQHLLKFGFTKINKNIDGQDDCAFIKFYKRGFLILTPKEKSYIAQYHNDYEYSEWKISYINDLQNMVSELFYECLVVSNLF